MLVRTRPRHFQAVQFNPPMVHPFEDDTSIMVAEAMIGTQQGTFPGYVMRTQTQQQGIMPGCWLIRQSGGITVMDQNNFDRTFETVTILEGELGKTP